MTLVIKKLMMTCDLYMMVRYCLLLGLLGLVGLSNEAFAQDYDDSTVYVITTYDDVEFIGHIITKDAREVLLRKDNGDEVFIPTYVIRSIQPLTESLMRKGIYLSGNPHASRYFYTPSAFPIEKGDGYIQTIYGGIWQFQYGITPRFSIGIGTPIIGAPVWITPKYSFNLGRNVYGALGAQVGSLGWILGDWSAVAGVGYGVLTFGSQQSNFSIGMGVLGSRIPSDEFVVTDSLNWTGYDRTVITQRSSLAFSLGGMKHLQKNMLVIGEFWALPNIDGNFSLYFGGPGLRMMRNQNLFDFGFWVFHVNNTDEPLTFPIPYISYTWKLL